MGEYGEQGSRARALFRQFLAERWYGGPDFESWVQRHADLADELTKLRDEWLARLAGEESPEAGLGELGWRSAESFAADEIFGGFRLRRRLGAGAMGEVWEAEELALGRRLVALKLLRPDLVSDHRKLERFRREALAGARIHHPGVVAVYSVGRVHAQPYIAQELVEGGVSLGELIATARRAGRPGPAHFQRAARLIAQAADALQAAHEIGIVHRDIKPQNVLVAPGDVVKVADFGLAHLAGENVLSETGDVMGTFSYMSPAQVQGRVKELDGRSDVFSLGATLYELLSFERAFSGESADEILHKILHADPLPLRKLVPAAPRELEILCGKALEKHTADRIPSMRTFAGELRRYLAGESILTGSTPAWRKARKWARRHPVTSTSGSVAIVALVGIAWLLLDVTSVRKDVSRAERDVLYARAQWAIETGDLERARGFIDQAVALDPRDPTANLIMASGFARYARITEVEEQLRDAREKGFADDPGELDSGLELGAYGLYLHGRNDFALYPRAEELIRRALELDPSLYSLQFTLFRIRAALGDRPGALAALAEFQRRFPAGDPFSRILEAKRLEFEDDLTGALAVLEGLAEELEADDEALAALGWRANIGRICFKLGQLERAAGYLRGAVEEVPSNCWSWGELAVTQMQRVIAGDSTPATLAEARECARRAQECSPSLESPYLVRVFVAEKELGSLPATVDPTGDPAWQEAREALDGYRKIHEEDSDEQRRHESFLLHLDGKHHLRIEDYAGAAERFEHVLELDPENLEAAALLGNCDWRLKKPREGLEVLARALDLWDAPTLVERPEPSVLGTILGWMLGNATAAGDPAAYERARERLVLELDRGTTFDRKDLLNAAEFLGTAKELRDCELARALIDANALRTAFEGTADAPEVRSILEKIDAACP